MALATLATLSLLAGLTSAQSYQASSFLRRHPDKRYLNYGLEPYVNYSLGSDVQKQYDFLGNYLVEGYRVFTLEEVRPGISQRSGSLLAKEERFATGFTNLIIANDTYRGWSARLTVGDAIRTIFTPLTLNLTRLNGARFDIADDDDAITLVLQRGGVDRTDPFNGLYSFPLVGDDDDRASIEAAPVYTSGLHWQKQFGDVLTLGFTAVSQQQGNSLAEVSESPSKGELPYSYARPEQLMLVVMDDSPRDPSKATVYNVALNLRGQFPQGTRTSGRPPTSVRRIRPEDMEAAAVAANRPWPWEHAITNLSIVRQLWSNNVPPALFEQPDAPLSVTGEGALIYIFEMPAGNPTGAVFKVDVSGDYRLATSQRHPYDTRNLSIQQNLPVTDVVEATRYTPWLVRSRAPGNISDGSNRKTINVEHRVTTGQTLLGIDGTLYLGGLAVTGEYVSNRQHGRFPISTGERTEDNTSAWYVNASKIFGPLELGGEWFSVDPNYSFGYNNTRGGISLYNDFRNPRVAMVEDVNLPATALSQTQVYQEFGLVDDNDDDDQYPDDQRFDWPGSISPDGGVFPGLDENRDRIPDDDQNSNGLPDFAEPFLLFDSDPIDFVYGDDWNNNGIIDSRENDNLPDYPYRVDQEGRNLFATLKPGENSGLTFGRYSVDGSAGGGVTKAWYVLGSWRHISYLYGEISVKHDTKWVEDTIPDHLFVFDPDDIGDPLRFGGIVPTTSDGRANSGWDDLAMRDSRVHTTWLGTTLKGLRWLPSFMPAPKSWREIGSLEIENNLKVTQNIQQGALAAASITTFASAHRLGFSWNKGPLTIQPQIKALVLVETHDNLDEPVQDEIALAPILRVDYQLTPQTVIRFGQQGVTIPGLNAFEWRNLLATRTTDRANPRRTRATTDFLISIANISELVGFTISTNLGYARTTIDFKDPLPDFTGLGTQGQTKRSRLFISMVVGGF